MPYNIQPAVRIMGYIYSTLNNWRQLLAMFAALPYLYSTCAITRLVGAFLIFQNTRWCMFVRNLKTKRVVKSEAVMIPFAVFYQSLCEPTHPLSPNLSSDHLNRVDIFSHTGRAR